MKPTIANSYEPSSCSAEATRADRRWHGARVVELEPGGPAEREGLEVGMLVTHVNGVELRDMIDWDWEADGPTIYLEGIAHEGTPDEFEFECEVNRTWGEDWGVTFDGAVFDGMRLCRNNCTFCFMKMLPPNMRKTLYMRDDDYRLSFLQGNFVTLTNMTDDDVERVVEHALSPLNVSLHAVTPEVRAQLIGKHAARGLYALEQLLAHDIEVHAQIVLVPNQNDGDELLRTLDYVEARPNITSLGIVPLGFTRFQDTFATSFNDPGKARAVIEAVRPYQERSRRATGRTRFQLADEFYLAAKIDPPAGEEYDGYPQYDDGIGMLRSFLDDAHACLACGDSVRSLDALAARLTESRRRLVLVTGEAARGTLASFIQDSPLADAAQVFAVRNDYFGGNVDVAGLLTACDVLAQLPDNLAGTVVALPALMFNADDLTLDGMSRVDLCAGLAARGAATVVVPTEIEGFIASVVGL